MLHPPTFFLHDKSETPFCSSPLHVQLHNEIQSLPVILPNFITVKKVNSYQQTVD
eukprot:m.107154 g.107154  ORF g.107154 m.107154 type:complete len:55 (+) comp12685_c7_seq4:942-1106(+)